MNNQLNANRLAAVVVAMLGLYWILDEIRKVIDLLMGLATANSTIRNLTSNMPVQVTSQTQDLISGNLWFVFAHLVVQFVIGCLLVAKRDSIAAALFPVTVRPTPKA